MTLFPSVQCWLSQIGTGDSWLHHIAGQSVHGRGLPLSVVHGCVGLSLWCKIYGGVEGLLPGTE